MSLMLDMTKFTKTERFIVELLSDGQVHNVDEILRKCISADAESGNLYPHITSLRKKLSPSGLLVTYVAPRSLGKSNMGYQMSRRLFHEE